MKNVVQMSRLGMVAALAAGAMIAMPLVAQTTPAATGQGAAQPQGERTITNAHVLPADIPRERLIEIMRGWSTALGVDCSFCHTPAAGPAAADGRQRFDFPSDANPHKAVARQMVTMLQAINRNYFAGAVSRSGPPASAVCSASASQAATLMPWPNTGLKLQMLSPSASTPSGRWRSRS